MTFDRMFERANPVAIAQVPDGAAREAAQDAIQEAYFDPRSRLTLSRIEGEDDADWTNRTVGVLVGIAKRKRPMS
jgi:hypothetical protein